jgi:CHASE3 domain sensor protein
MKPHLTIKLTDLLKNARELDNARQILQAQEAHQLRDYAVERTRRVRQNVKRRLATAIKHGDQAAVSTLSNLAERL